MNIKKQIIILSLLGSLIFQGAFVPKAQAYQLSAVSIYQQAVRKNHNFFRQVMPSQYLDLDRFIYNLPFILIIQ